MSWCTETRRQLIGHATEGNRASAVVHKLVHVHKQLTFFDSITILKQFTQSDAKSYDDAGRLAERERLSRMEVCGRGSPGPGPD